MSQTAKALRRDGETARVTLSRPDRVLLGNFTRKFYSEKTSWDILVLRHSKAALLGKNVRRHSKVALRVLV